MPKRKNLSWYRRHQTDILAIVVIIQALIIFGFLLSPCRGPIRPAEMPKVTPQIKPPYQWGQRV